MKSGRIGMAKKGERKEVMEEIIIEKGCKEPKAYKRNVLKEEPSEFLKLIKQSNYKVIEQLNRTPTRISLLSLFLNSKPHIQVLMNILNQVHELKIWVVLLATSWQIITALSPMMKYSLKKWDITRHSISL